MFLSDGWPDWLKRTPLIVHLKSLDTSWKRFLNPLFKIPSTCSEQSIIMIIVISRMRRRGG